MKITIRASQGYILTDGENYATTFDLADGKSPSDYYEITQEKYEEILREQEQ